MIRSAMHRLAALGLALLFLGPAAHGQSPTADTPAQARSIVGSQVKVHQAAASDAPVVAQLNADTAVSLRPGDDGLWCEIDWAQGQHGFVPCWRLKKGHSAAVEPKGKHTAAAAIEAEQAPPAELENNKAPAATAKIGSVPPTQATGEGAPPAADLPAASGEPRRTVGAQAKVHQAASSDAPVVAQLDADTAVTLLSGGNGLWCEIDWAQGHHGFVPCWRLKKGHEAVAEAGARRAPETEAKGEPAPAAEAAAAPPVEARREPEPAATKTVTTKPVRLDPNAPALRAFWASPDVDTFLAAGHDLDLNLLDPLQIQAEHPGLRPPAPAPSDEIGGAVADTALPPPRVSLADFEAMKQKLAKGVVAPHQLWQAPPPWSRMLGIAAAAHSAGPGIQQQAFASAMEHLVTYPQIPLPPAQPSYFNSLDVVGRPSADARALSAQFPIRHYTVRVAGPAHWVQPRQGPPWVYGAWDAGALDIRLASPMQELLLDGRGRLSLQDTLAEARLDAADDAPACADPTTGRWRYSRAAANGGAPGNSAWPTVLMRTRVPLDLDHAKIDTREVPLAPRPDGQRPFQRGTLTTIDLDGDHVPDLALWDAYRPLPGQGDAVLSYRMVLLNAAGTWYVLDSDNWNDCEGPGR